VPARATQQVAACPVATVCNDVTDPFACSAKLPSAFAPASATIRCCSSSKPTANGTAPATVFTTGAADRFPTASTEKTSIALPLPFVVTITCEPSGANATWPGVCVNSGTASGSRPSARAEPAIAASRPSTIA